MIAILGCHGIGDLLHSVRLSKLIQKKQGKVQVVLACDETKFRVLNYLFPEENLVRIDEKWGENECLVRNPGLIKEIPELRDFLPNVFVAYPDLLDRHPLAIPYKPLDINLQQLYSERILTNRWKSEQMVTIAVNSSTPGYHYERQLELAKHLGLLLPGYTIYWSVLSNWAGHNLKLDNSFDNWEHELPQNVKAEKDIDIVSFIKILEISEYIICSDNGPSHIAWALGANRLLLDPRFGYSGATIPWQVRWRENMLNDSIPINTEPQDIAKLVKLNIDIPQTMLLPRHVVQTYINSDWHRALGFKF